MFMFRYNFHEKNEFPCSLPAIVFKKRDSLKITVVQVAAGNNLNKIQAFFHSFKDETVTVLALCFIIQWIIIHSNGNTLN